MRILFLLGRVVFGGFFLTSGLMDLRHSAKFAPLVGASGVPFPHLAVIVAGLLITLGGMSIILGLWPRLGAALIVLFLVLVTPIAHNFWAHRSNRRQYADDLNNFTKNLGLLGATLMIMTMPQPWPYSIPLSRRRA
jgi:putative oxidoreductase